MKKMSEKQVKANQANAQLGGVKTDEGKAITRFNSITHGILREAITEYENFDFKTLHNTLIKDYPPRTILEELLIERIAVAYIKLLRASKAEAEFIKDALVNGFNFVPCNFNSNDSFEIQLKSEQIDKLASLYSRYETSAENRFYKAINKLIELRQDAA